MTTAYLLEWIGFAIQVDAATFGLRVGRVGPLSLHLSPQPTVRPLTPPSLDDIGYLVSKVELRPKVPCPTAKRAEHAKHCKPNRWKQCDQVLLQKRRVEISVIFFVQCPSGHVKIGNFKTEQNGNRYTVYTGRASNRQQNTLVGDGETMQLATKWSHGNSWVVKIWRQNYQQNPKKNLKQTNAGKKWPPETKKNPVTNLTMPINRCL